MDNDSTRNRDRLSPAERHKRGLLALDEELLLHEIMGLEFPTATSYEDRKKPEYEEWKKKIETAIRFSLLVTRQEPSKTERGVIFRENKYDGGRQQKIVSYYTPSTYWIDRNSYQTWRTSQSNQPAGSFINLWLGATPAVETLPPAEPSLLKPPATTARLKPKTVLLTLLDEVDKRAAEQGAGFNRECLPGTKAEFQILALAFNHSAFSKALSTFSDYLDGHCQFSPGVKPEHGKGAVIWALFPEYDLKLG